ELSGLQTCLRQVGHYNTRSWDCKSQQRAPALALLITYPKGQEILTQKDKQRFCHFNFFSFIMTLQTLYKRPLVQNEW
ncbi:MAG: hypothetical protein WBI53_14030, partial [Paludibacter sp.]